MANVFFQFKQFRIDQQYVSMKVTTEGCLFGSYIGIGLSPQRILDIGTGTGLLALMMAQRFPQSAITGVEVDPKAVEQARANFENSPWKKRLFVYPRSIQDFESKTFFDFIVANPPFFTNHLKSGNQRRNQAIHADSLPMDELILAVNRLLTSAGTFAVIYPAYESNLFIEMASKYQLFCVERLRVYDRPGRPVLREILTFSRTRHLQTNKSMIIKTKQGVYSEEFNSLVAPFYLHL